MFRIVGEKPEGNKGVSSMQAFFISAASRVGTGNLTGVALAIATGGPGAVFWMWVVAAVGMASSFVESTLAQLYKVRDGEDFRGGPAYYIQKGLGARWLGIVFAILITVSFGLIFNAVQTNTIAGALDGAFHVNKIVVAIVLAVLTAFIIFGGLKRVVAVSQLIVPVMAGIYILIALFVVITNITAFPGVIATIVKNALGFEQVVGGGIGGIIVIGAQRGLFQTKQEWERTKRGCDGSCIPSGKARLYSNIRRIFRYIYHMYVHSIYYFAVQCNAKRRRHPSHTGCS